MQIYKPIKHHKIAAGIRENFNSLKDKIKIWCTDNKYKLTTKGNYFITRSYIELIVV